MNIDAAISLLKRMIATPSHSREEAAVADIMEQELKALGFAPLRKGNNVWACSLWDDKKPTILLDAHIDTVRPNGAWSRDAYTPTVEGDKLYGLGSNDTGGSVVSLLMTFVHLTKHEQPYNLIYLASAEEEVTGAGGVRAVLPELGKIDFAIVGEPTDMQPAIAEKGLMVLDCVAHGVAGHAAREEGVNAIYKALKDIEWFRTHRFEKVSELLGPVKMSVTGIEAGTQHNVVPAECRFMVDIRVNECYSNEELLELIRQHVECDVQPRSTHLNSSYISCSHPAMKRLLDMGCEAFGSPTMSNQAVMPFPTLKLGPGRSERSHTADEYIHISEIAHAVEVYCALLDDLKI